MVWHSDSLFLNGLGNDVSGFLEANPAQDSGFEGAGWVVVQSWPFSFHTPISDNIDDVPDHIDFILGSVSSVKLAVQKVVFVKGFLEDINWLGGSIVSIILIGPDLDVSILVNPDHFTVDVEGSGSFVKVLVALEGLVQNMEGFGESQLRDVGQSMGDVLGDYVELVFGHESLTLVQELVADGFHDRGIGSFSFVVNGQFSSGIVSII